MDALLLVDIGNTHTRVYRPQLQDGLLAFERIQMLETATWNTPLVLAAETVWVASVVPEKNNLLHAHGRVHFLSAKNGGNALCFSPEINTQTLGTDRLANALNVWTRANGAFPAIGIDCGSCITFEIFDGKGVFASGGILPGRLLMRRALQDYTGLLPFVPLRDAPMESPGVDTVSAIAWGIDSGVIGAVLELIAQAERVYGPLQTKVLTGGDAPFFLKRLAAQNVVYDPDSVVRGLYYASSAE